MLGKTSKHKYLTKSHHQNAITCRKVLSSMLSHEGAGRSKVVNFIPFCSEWSKRSIPIQKTEQISSHFKSRSVPDFSAKFHPERFCFIPHVPFRS